MEIAIQTAREIAEAGELRVIELDRKTLAPRVIVVVTTCGPNHLPTKVWRVKILTPQIMEKFSAKINVEKGDFVEFLFSQKALYKHRADPSSYLIVKKVR